MTAPTIEAQRAAVQRALAPGRRDAPGSAESVWDDARRFYRPRFPSTEHLGKVVAGIASTHGVPKWDGAEGSRARMSVSAGTVGVNYKNLARYEHTHERAVEDRRKRVDELGRALVVDGQFPPAPVPRQVITVWSRKSRSNMRQAFHQLDYEPLFRRGHVPAMITLTYPGDWTEVAPDGPASKRHLQMFRKRFQRAWGYALRAIWKLEFQRRGAPHYHLMIVPPHGRALRGRYAGFTFKRWLSETWANILGHPDPEQYARNRRAGTRIDFASGVKASDPRRVAVYFAKHGSFRAKEYQHNVPAEWQGPGVGPGRFWGYWNLQRPVHGVELSFDDAIAVSRTLRRLSASQGVSHEIPVPRYRAGRLCPTIHEVVGLAGAVELDAQAPVRWRLSRRRVRRMRGQYGAGWLSSNDGPRLASDVARYLSIVADDPPGPGPSEPAHPPGICRECGEPRRRHRCPAWYAGRSADAARAMQREAVRAAEAAERWAAKKAQVTPQLVCVP